MEDIRDEQLGQLLDRWARAIEPNPEMLQGLPPKRPRRDRAVRLTVSIAVAAVFIAIAAWGVTVVGYDKGHTGPLGPSSTLHTITNPKGIPITVSYPGDWFARENSGNTWLFGDGLVVVNNRREANWDHLPGDSGGPFGTHIRDFVGLTVFKARHRAPAPTDSTFPLDMANAKVDPGWGQESVRYLNAQVGGMPIRIMVLAAKDASAQDIATAEAIVASIRPTAGASTPLSFTPANGWYDRTYTHKPGSSDPSQAWTSNVPFGSGVQTPAFPDTSALASGQILVLAWEVHQGPPDPTNPNFPIVQGPVQLAEPSTGYEGMTPGITKSMILAQINGRYLQVNVFFGSSNPGSDMKDAAQSALDRLVVSPSLNSHPEPNVPSDKVSLGGAIQGTKWKLALANGREWPGGERDVTLEFLARRLGGSNGCNSYGANWTMEGRRLHVGVVQSTSMACLDVATAHVSNLLWEVLRSSPMLTLRDQQLRMKSSAGVLVFSET